MRPNTVYLCPGYLNRLTEHVAGIPTPRVNSVTATTMIVELMKYNWNVSFVSTAV